jgi:hypothetical protein
VGHAADPALGVPEVKPKQLCLLAFLPHILDSQAAGREAYLQVGRRGAAGGGRWARVRLAAQGAVERLSAGTRKACTPSRGYLVAPPRSVCSNPPPPLPPPPRALLQILRGLTAKFKDRPFSYLWAEGGAQPGLEANFGVGGEQGGRVRRLGEPSPAGSSRQLGSGSVAGGWHGLAPPPGCAVCLPSTSTALAPKIALCVNLRSLAHSV